MFRVTRTRFRWRNVLRVRTQFVSVEMTIVHLRLRVTHSFVIAPAETSKQQINLFVCFLSHCKRDAAK
jgi:hypothetical protein